MIENYNEIEEIDDKKCLDCPKKYAEDEEFQVLECGHKICNECLLR